MRHTAASQAGLVRRGRAREERTTAVYAASIEKAVQRAMSEMGPEAMLLDSRRAPPEARHMGEYEVRFAVPDRLQEAPPRTVAAGNSDFARDLARIRREMADMRKALLGEKQPAEMRPLDAIGERLEQQGVARDLAAEISESIAALPPARAQGAPEQLLEAELRRRLTASQRCASAAEPRAIAVIGPPGAGKTTTLIKLAVRHHAAGRGPAVLINTDTIRIGAAEQMARYAAILGLPLLTADTRAGLRQVIDAAAPRSLMLIDTPGLSGADVELFEPVGQFLAERADVERRLVLSATMHWSDLSRAVKRYESFRPTRMTFTNLDQTNRFGGLLTTACRAGIPVASIAAGQRIPDDLEAATAETLARLIVGGPAEQDARERDAA